MKDRQEKLRDHLARNQELLSVFARKQVNINEIREIEIHFWAEDRDSAMQLNQQLLSRGFNTRAINAVSTPDDTKSWNVEVSIDTTITSVVSEIFTGDLIDVAASCGAQYDGWGTAV